MLRIQVKGKQGKEWPLIKGISGKDILLVFVDFENKKENERPDLYILTAKDWERLLKIEKKKQGDQPDIKPEMIKEYKERWDKIKEIVGGK
jgi:spore coat polysaccharide biosynthesis protein SpsF (cytidylyltransferase family)